MTLNKDVHREHFTTLKIILKLRNKRGLKYRRNYAMASHG